MPEPLDKPNAPGLWAWYDDGGGRGLVAVNQGERLANNQPNRRWVLVRPAEPELPKVQLVEATKDGQRVIAADGLRNVWVYWYVVDGGETVQSAADKKNFTDIRQLYPITREVAERVAEKVWHSPLNGRQFVEVAADVIVEELG